MASEEDICSLHSEKLKLFCLDHQQPLCLVCRDSEIHANHKIRPLEEAAQQHIKTLQETLKPLKEKLNNSGNVNVKFDQATKHIKVQARHTEKQIKEQFKKLHKFLEDEEEARLGALREEEQQKSRRMHEKMEARRKELDDLSDTIRATEQELRAGPVSFLKNYKAAVQRAQQRPMLEDPKLPRGALIDVAKHLGNLSFNIWNKMKDVVSHSPVILDPNTAHPNLTVSDDLMTIRQVGEQQLPANPERFDCLFSVLGSEGFDSGTHSWDVEVGHSEVWTVGVITESFDWNAVEKTGYWRIGACENSYSVRSSPNPPSFLKVHKKPKRIRVNLNWERGVLSFTDPDTNVHLYTFSHYFTQRVFPLINSVDGLKLLPSKVSVKVE